MTLSQDELEVILQDTSKTIEGDIVWQKDELWLKFKVEIISELDNYQLSIRGTYNPLIYTVSYHIICPPYGRIYGLDLGKDHKNPDGQFVGEKHKHRWNEIYRDKQAYVPDDITVTGESPVQASQEFCKEAIIRHNGSMQAPPLSQLDLFL